MSHLLYNLCQNAKPFKSRDFVDKGANDRISNDTSLTPFDTPCHIEGMPGPGFNGWVIGDFDDDLEDPYGSE